MTDARPLLSRVAASGYWMARYIERAENLARFIGVGLHLQLDMPLDPVGQWNSLVHATGDAKLFKERHGAATQAKVIEFLSFDQQNLNSISSCIRAARENARSVRETISSEMWEQVNSMYLMTPANGRRPEAEMLPEYFRSIRLACHLFQGITDTTMTQNEAWHFLRTGRELERADKASRILDVKYFMLLPSLADVGTPYDNVLWSAVLKCLSGFEMYRKKHGRISPRDIVQFLVMDAEFPRAIRYCIHRADRSLHEITGTPPGSFHYRCEQLMGQLEAHLNYTSVDGILRDGLHEFLDDLQLRMNGVDEHIQREFFALRPSAVEASV